MFRSQAIGSHGIPPTYPLKLQCFVVEYALKYGLQDFFESSQYPNALLIHNKDSQKNAIPYYEVDSGFKFLSEPNSTKDLLLSCFKAGLPEAVFGITTSLFKVNNNVCAWPIKPNRVLYQVLLASYNEQQCLQYFNYQMCNDLNRLFTNLDEHLKGIFGSYSLQKYTDLLNELKLTEILSVKACDDDMGKRVKALVPLRAPPLPPKKLTIKANPQSPSTSIIVFYKRPANKIVNRYVVAAQNLESTTRDKPVEVETAQLFAVIRGLSPGQSYLIWAQSVKDGIRSERKILRNPIRTAQFDPHPWRAVDAGSVAVAGEVTEVQEDIAARGEPTLWNSDLHKELKRILGMEFPDPKMRQLLLRCDELGIAGVNDLKYLGRKEITDELKGTIKPVEILKLVDYAKDKYSG